MINPKNILRQITDIQVQADRLIKNKADVIEIEQFSDYSKEIKTFLINTIDDEFIPTFVLDIPDLDIDEIDPKSGLLHLILNMFGAGLGIYSRERDKANKALRTINDIKGKYASAEFMLKNYFD